MNNGNEKQKNEWVFLGRGISRTFFRDVKVTVLGVSIGAVLGLLAAFLLGLSAQFGVKIGALVGAFVALSARSHWYRLFEYDKIAPGKDPES